MQFPPETSSYKIHSDDPIRLYDWILLEEIKRKKNYFCCVDYKSLCFSYLLLRKLLYLKVHFRMYSLKLSTLETSPLRLKGHCKFTYSDNNQLYQQFWSGRLNPTVADCICRWNWWQFQETLTWTVWNCSLELYKVGLCLFVFFFFKTLDLLLHYCAYILAWIQGYWLCHK